MPTTIVSIEKKYPEYIFHLSTGKKYRARIFKIEDGWNPYGVEYISTQNRPMKNRPSILTPYHFLEWVENSRGRKEQWECFDAISSLPNFSFDDFSYSGFVCVTNYFNNPKQIVKLYTKYGNNLCRPEFICDYLPEYYNLTEEETIIFRQLWERNTSLATGYCADKKIRHLYIRAIENPAASFFSIGRIFEVITQFLDACKLLGIKPPTGEFWKNAKITIAAAEQKQKEVDEATFAAAQKKHNLFYENDDFFTVVPTTYKECVDEGAYMHNCVGGIEWNNYLKNGSRYIVFIRRKSEPDKPYIDLDMSERLGRLTACQIYTQYNTCEWLDDEKAHAFIDEYKQYLETLK